MAGRRTKPAEPGDDQPLAIIETKPRRPAEASIDPAAAQEFMEGVEAVLMSADRPVTAHRIADAVTPPSGEDEPASLARSRAALVDDAVRRLNDAYASTSRSFRIESVAGGYRVMTLARHAKVVGAFRKLGQSTRLSKPAIETLAIIAYKQPVTRAQLEAIRGVSCGEVLRGLLERRLVTIRGRAEELGRPILYGTTKAFLDHFGLGSINDLPTPEELRPVP